MAVRKESSANLISNSDRIQSASGCGFGPWRPSCLQIFAKPTAFLILLNIYCIVEGTIVSGLTSVVLSSLETRYKFSSLQLGMMSSTFDITVLVTVVFISYFGETHKPKWLGVGVFIQGIGALLFASPQFITGDYDVGKDANLTLEKCRDESDFSPECRKSDNIYALFIIANMVIAVGAAPLFTVGTSYIDDIVHPKRAPIWLGLFYTWAVVGPALGFGIGGGFLTVYVDPWRETTLEESDPGWVGAWWIGYVICGVLSLLISVPFFMFPEKYPDTDLIQQERIKQMSIQYKREVSKEDLSIKFHIKELPPLVISGLVAFAPKYTETQFGLPASTSSLIGGAVGIPSAGVGIMLGALLVFIRKPMTKTLSLYFAVLNLIAAFFLVAFFLNCSTHDIAGVTVPYPNSTLFDDQSLNATCNSHCDCKSTVFEPVCSDGITYFSPCRAGCDKYFLNSDRNEPRFENCTCSGADTAEEGYCDENCVMLGPYLLLLALALVTNMSTQIPNVVVTLRCIADEQRTLALGLQSVFFRMLGSIPGPIIVGTLFDSSCLYWQEECENRGNCWVYDNNNLSLGMFGMSAGVRVVSVIFAFCAWIFFDVTFCNRDKVEELDKEMTAVNANSRKDFSSKDDTNTTSKDDTNTTSKDDTTAAYY